MIHVGFLLHWDRNCLCSCGKAGRERKFSESAVRRLNIGRYHILYLGRTCKQRSADSQSNHGYTSLVSLRQETGICAEDALTEA